MRLLCGTMALAFAAGVACANRTSMAAVDVMADTAATGHVRPAVVGTTGMQAARRLTPADLEARMKDIGERYPAMRRQLMAGMTAGAAKEATELATLFGDVEQFWAQRDRDDAVKWAQEARTNAIEAAGAATANEAMKAMQAADNMQAACKQCHGTYREVDPRGGFRIRSSLNIE